MLTQEVQNDIDEIDSHKSETDEDNAASSNSSIKQAAPKQTSFSIGRPSHINQQASFGPHKSTKSGAIERVPSSHVGVTDRSKNSGQAKP